MKKIYILYMKCDGTSVAAFSSKKKRKKFLEAYEKTDQVFEFGEDYLVLDPKPAVCAKQYRKVLITKEGKVERNWLENYDNGTDYKFPKKVISYTYFGCVKILTVYVKTPDEEIAAKTAKDYLDIILVNNVWGKVLELDLLFP